MVVSYLYVYFYLSVLLRARMARLSDTARRESQAHRQTVVDETVIAIQRG
jgi:hypothetical protein